jgi:hypothetical protein
MMFYMQQLLWFWKFEKTVLFKCIRNIVDDDMATKLVVSSEYF